MLSARNRVLVRESPIREVQELALKSARLVRGMCYSSGTQPGASHQPQGIFASVSCVSPLPFPNLGSPERWPQQSRGLVASSLLGGLPALCTSNATPLVSSHIPSPPGWRRVYYRPQLSGRLFPLFVRSNIRSGPQRRARLTVSCSCFDPCRTFFSHRRYPAPAAANAYLCNSTNATMRYVYMHFHFHVFYNRIARVS